MQELSLHQQDLERIELLDNVCRDLRILYLQNNIIPKIENVSRLKELEYLNLALNNVERIEGLEGCEMLRKLDLTVNFVGDIFSVGSLRCNRELRELYLTGNPCSQFDGYRAFVVATLPQLENLDGVKIPGSERLLAMQELDVLTRRLEVQVKQYTREREAKRAEKKSSYPPSPFSTASSSSVSDSFTPGIEEIEVDAAPEGSEEATTAADDVVVVEDILDEEAQKRFWEEEVEHSPEARVAMHKHQEAVKAAEERKANPPKPKKKRRFFREDGRPFNINEAGWEFTLTGQEHTDPALALDFACYKYLATSEISCDVQPQYVRITVRDKVFQLVLPEEVKPDSGTAQRSQITGHLLVTMPKAAADDIKAANKRAAAAVKAREDKAATAAEAEALAKGTTSGALLDNAVGMGDGGKGSLRVGSIVADAKAAKAEAQAAKLLSHRTAAVRPETRANDEGFVDDPDVPPMM